MPCFFVVASIHVQLAATVRINIFFQGVTGNTISSYGTAVTPAPCSYQLILPSVRRQAYTIKASPMTIIGNDSTCPIVTQSKAR